MMETAFRFRRLGKAPLMVVLALTLSVSTVAQTSSDDTQQNNLGFTDSIAKFIYSLAWPTATYKDWHMEWPEKDADGGYDLVVKISGLSGFDQSDLWLKLAIAIRSGNIDHYNVLDHNGAIPPFFTVAVVGTLVEKFNEEYQKSKASQPPATASSPAYDPTPSPSPPPATTATPAEHAPPTQTVGVCIQNTTNGPVSYSYRWDYGSIWKSEWKQTKVDSGYDMIHTYKLNALVPTPPQFDIEYGGGSVDGAPQDYVLENGYVPPSANCEDAKQYTFASNGQLLVLTAASAPATTTAPSDSTASTAVAAVCIQNPLSAPVTYSYRWGAGDWQQDEVDPGKAWVYTHELSSVQTSYPTFQIQYYDGLRGNYTQTLSPNTASAPATCDTAKQYTYTTNGQLIYLNLTN